MWISVALWSDIADDQERNENTHYCFTTLLMLKQTHYRGKCIGCWDIKEVVIN